MRQHSSEPEGDFLRKLFAMHGYFETVTEVNMHDFTGTSFKEHVGGMSISEA
jgi:hypothetical protein